MNDFVIYYLTHTCEMFKECLRMVTQEDLTPKLEYAINELELIINWVAKR
jgi:hypothetical protein